MNKTVLVCCQNNEEACIYFFMIIFVGINLHTLMGCYKRYRPHNIVLSDLNIVIIIIIFAFSVKEDSTIRRSEEKEGAGYSSYEFTSLTVQSVVSS